jgi:hypothetical protein
MGFNTSVREVLTKKIALKMKKTSTLEVGINSVFIRRNLQLEHLLLSKQPFHLQY